MAKVFLAFRGHGNVSSADARKIADCAAALHAACEAAGIESRASVDVSGVEADAPEIVEPAAEPVAEAPVQEFAVEAATEVAAVRVGRPRGPRR